MASQGHTLSFLQAFINYDQISFITYGSGGTVEGLGFKKFCLELNLKVIGKLFFSVIFSVYQGQVS
jgi:hypothetical protein